MLAPQAVNATSRRARSRSRPWAPHQTAHPDGPAIRYRGHPGRRVRKRPGPLRGQAPEKRRAVPGAARAPFEMSSRLRSSPGASVRLNSRAQKALLKVAMSKPLARAASCASLPAGSALGRK